MVLFCITLRRYKIILHSLILQYLQLCEIIPQLFYLFKLKIIIRINYYNNKLIQFYFIYTILLQHYIVQLHFYDTTIQKQPNLLTKMVGWGLGTTAWFPKSTPRYILYMYKSNIKILYYQNIKLNINILVYQVPLYK